METNPNPEHQEETEYHGDYYAFTEGDDPFVESDEWIAAEVRQLFRAHRANDGKGEEVALFYLNDYLEKTLHRHLRRVDSEWCTSISDIVNSGPSGRWFDGLAVEPEYLSPGRLRLRGRVSWVQNTWYYDPFEFEIQLSPTTGAFRWYIMRFGDHRPLADKLSPVSISATPVGGWAYRFTRNQARNND